MILVDKRKEEEFIKLLSNTASYTKEKLGNSKTVLTGDEFEDITYNFMNIVAKSTPYEGKINHTGTLSFPDIIIPEYKQGIEVKVTRSGKWQSLGNSVAEHTRLGEVERIYMYFGNISNNKTEIKFRPYQECLSDILVTHSPRYKIDMELPIGKSIFDKMDIDYDSFRINDPIKQAKNYYKKQLKAGEDLWWIDSNETQGQNIIIKSYNNLNTKEKELFLLEVFILFPEVLSDSNPDKYTRIGAFLLQRFGTLCSNLRDIFSAGGKVELTVGGKKDLYPRVIGKLKISLDKILELITTIPTDLFAAYWSNYNTKEDLVTQWLREIGIKAGQDKRILVEVMLNK